MNHIATLVATLKKPFGNIWSVHKKLLSWPRDWHSVLIMSLLRMYLFKLYISKISTLQSHQNYSQVRPCLGFLCLFLKSAKAVI